MQCYAAGLFSGEGPPLRPDALLRPTGQRIKAAYQSRESEATVLLGRTWLPRPYFQQLAE